MHELEDRLAIEFRIRLHIECVGRQQVVVLCEAQRVVFSEVLQGRSYRHLAQPAFKYPAAVVLIQVFKNSQKSILQHILGLRSVPGVAQANKE